MRINKFRVITFANLHTSFILIRLNTVVFAQLLSLWLLQALQKRYDSYIPKTLQTNKMWVEALFYYGFCHVQKSSNCSYVYNQ